MKIILNKTALKSMMAQNGEDVYALASRMGVAPSTIYRILSGDRGVGSQMIAKLLWAFDLTEKGFEKLFIVSE